MSPFSDQVNIGLAGEDQHQEYKRLKPLKVEQKHLLADPYHDERNHQPATSQHQSAPHQRADVPLIGLRRSTYPVGRQRHRNNVIGEQEQQNERWARHKYAHEKQAQAEEECNLESLDNLIQRIGQHPLKDLAPYFNG